MRGDFRRLCPAGMIEEKTGLLFTEYNKGKYGFSRKIDQRPRIDEG